MTVQSQGPSSSYPIDTPSSSKHQERATIAAQTAEWIKEHGDPPLVRNKTTAEIIAGVELKSKAGLGFRNNGKNSGRPKKEVK